MSELKCFLNQHPARLLSVELQAWTKSLSTECGAIYVNPACGFLMVMCSLSVHINLQKSAQNILTNELMPVAAEGLPTDKYQEQLKGKLNENQMRTDFWSP